MCYRSQLVLLASCAMLLSACKKVEKNIIYIDGAYSQFNVKVIRPYIGIMEEDTVNHVDSAFYFVNLAKRGDSITYHWDFGDGNSSEDIEPIHRYTATGSYTVTMETRVLGIPSDTAMMTIRAIKGQKNISLNENVHTTGIDIVPLNDGRYLLLGKSQAIETQNSTANFFLMLLDNRHQQLSFKALPGDEIYSGLTSAGDGNFLLTSRKTNGNQATLTKINTDGGVLWSKPYEDINAIQGVNTTADGGLLLTASRNTADTNGDMIALTYLIKTDNAGTVNWEHFFTGNDALYNSEQVYVDADGGYVVAGADIDYNNPYCWHCSSLSLIKLSEEGTVVWRHRAPWSTWRAGGINRVHKLVDNRFLVSTQGSNTLYYFSGERGFEDRKLLANDVKSTTVTRGNNIIVSGSWQSGNGSTVTIIGLDSRSIQRWEAGVDAVLRRYGEYACCPQTYPLNVIALPDGGTLVMALRSQYRSSWTSYLQTLLVELDENGDMR